MSFQPYIYIWKLTGKQNVPHTLETLKFLYWPPLEKEIILATVMVLKFYRGYSRSLHDMH